MSNGQKKKILLVLPTLDGGGAERIMLTLASYLATEHAEDLEVALAVFERTGAYQGAIPKKVALHDLAVPRARHAIFALKRLCKKIEPDVVITTMQATTAFFFARLLMHKKPFWISRLENPFSYDVAGMHRVVRFCFRRALLACDRVISLGQGMTDDLRAQTGIDAARIVQIYNPIDVATVERRSREEIDVALHHPAIVMCGRLTKQKGYSDAIAAYAHVLKKRPDAHLYILGVGEEEDCLREDVHARGIDASVHFLGFKENPYAYMARADVFMLSSLWEGFGNVIVEALAAGAPVVSTDCPTGPREILKDGTYGELVPVGDADALAAAVLGVLEGAARAPKARGQQRANAFAVSTIGKKYYELITQSV